VGEGQDGVVEAGGVADVGGDGDRVSGAGVAAGEELAVEVGVGDDAAGAAIGWLT